MRFYWDAAQGYVRVFRVSDRRDVSGCFFDPDKAVWQGEVRGAVSPEGDVNRRLVDEVAICANALERKLANDPLGRWPEPSLTLGTHIQRQAYE